MKFILPEHATALFELKQDEKLVSKPDLDDKELSSIEYLFRDSARNDYSVEITWWEHYKEGRGKTNSFWGVIKWIDQQARRIKLVNDEDIQWISMDKIVSVVAK